MTLPFDNSEKKNIKKYQCFVCGVMFEVFEVYKDHVIEEHDEGREYIRCPLNRCGAPVRDLRLHYKVKHPSEKIPKNAQMKALVWKSFTPRGKARTTKKFKEGWYTSTKMGRRLRYRSGYEETVYELLDTWDKVLAFEPEPFEIPYVHKGEGHNYKPDLLVKFTDGRHEVWEIKPANQTTIKKNTDKWDYAKKACETRGWRFKVITEKEIGKMKKLILG